MISSLTINKSIYTKGRVSIISDLNMTLPAALVAINRYLAPAPGLRKTSCTSLLLSIDGTDGRTDGQANNVPFHGRSPLEPGNAEK